MSVEKRYHVVPYVEYTNTYGGQGVDVYFACRGGTTHIPFHVMGELDYVNKTIEVDLDFSMREGLPLCHEK